METASNNWFQELFIDQAKPALNRHSGGSGGSGGLKITDAGYLFNNGARLDVFEELFGRIKDCTNLRYTFYNCKTLTSIPELDTSNVTSLENAFANCSALTSIPELDLSSCTRIDYAFGSCSKIRALTLRNTGNITSANRAFANCYALTEVSELDFGNLTSFYSLFDACSALTKVPVLNARSSMSFQSTFSGCRKLKTVEGIYLKYDVPQGYAITMSYMFNGCTALENLYLYDILFSLTICNGSYGTLLTVDSLVHTIKELRTVTKSQTLTMNSVCLAKIADLYCKVIDDADPKKPMELCESTDEGAMTLADYASLKGWQLK